MNIPTDIPHSIALATDGLIGNGGAGWTLQSGGCCMCRSWMGHGTPGSKPLILPPINKAVQELLKVIPNMV